MISGRDSIVLCALFVIFTFGRECTSQLCDIDFHMQSSSVMLLEGNNASVLCDASCYGGQGDVNAVWMDAYARPISSYPGRVFSVRYNRGLMNRLMVIGARQDTAGIYVCSVMRNGEQLQQKPLEFVVFGNSVSNNIPPVETGPRRGDMVPERDLDYRPVRSVERALSLLDSRSSPSVSDVTNDDSIGRGAVSEELNIDVTGYRHISNANQMSVLLRSLSKQNLHENSAFDNLPTDSSEQSKSFDTLMHVDASEVFSAIKAMRRSEFQSALDADIIKMSTIAASQLMNLKKTEKTDLKNHVDPPGNSYVSHTQGLSRVKRQNTDAPSTTLTSADMETTTPDSTTMADTTSDDFMNETTQTMSTGSTFSTTNWPAEKTSTEDDTSGENKTPDGDTDKAEQETTKEDVDNKGLHGDQTTTPCSQSRDSSNFGKYGVLAFAITLAVAVLLVYTILMIIFMPRILAKRKSKQDIEGAAYRKTDIGSSNNMEPLTILDSGEPQNPDPVQHKQETSDIDNSGSESGKDDSDNKDDESNLIPGKVSTFLLRQESQKKTEEESKEVRNGLETTNEDGGEKPNQPVTATAPASASDSKPDEPQKPPASASDPKPDEPQKPSPDTDLKVEA